MQEMAARALEGGTEMFISGGENVYPAEVEVALTHAAIAEAAPASAPDPSYARPEAIRRWARRPGSVTTAIAPMRRLTAQAASLPVRWANSKKAPRGSPLFTVATLLTSRTYRITKIASRHGAVASPREYRGG
jgi:acyl-CoA synthetase (AMP-forming)/AMP-acid ligase II